MRLEKATPKLHSSVNTEHWTTVRWFLLVAIVSLLGVQFLPTEWRMSSAVIVAALNVGAWLLFRPTRLGRREARKAKIKRLHEEWGEMVHTVEPSLFTLEHSGLRSEDLAGKTYVDQEQHWAAWVRIFFNPFAERQAEFKKSDTWLDRGFIYTLKGLALGVKIAWTITMVVTVAFIGVTIAHAPNAEDWPTWIVGVWTVWTVLWGIWSRKIWLGKRHVVTDDFLIVIVQRFPFEDPRSIRIPIADIQSATLTQSPVGWILRFCSLELDVKGSDDPAISILTYVHQGTRVDKNIEALRRREE